MTDLAYFYVLRDEARRRTVNALNRRLLKTGHIDRWDNLTLSSILGDEKGNALEFARDEWPKFYGPETHTGFPVSWERLLYRYLPRKDHFDIAIWQEVSGRQVLVALGLGNPSRSRTHLTVKWIERYFGVSPLAGRALWPILTAAEEYAKLLGCSRVLIKDAVDPAKYERYGYAAYSHPEVPHGGDYLGKEL